MKLSQLIDDVDEFQVVKSPAQDPDIGSLVFDSRQIESGCLFVAVRGGKSDGHAFLPDAQIKGAAAVVVEDAARVPNEFKGAVIKVADSRRALNKLAAHWYNHPADRMFCVGVTGTNGKTTTTYMIEAVLNARGWNTGVIGTINHHLGSRIWKTEMTTPDPLSFQKRLSEFETLGARAVALEASSHALRQSRIDEVAFNVAVFSNLTRDHLDYHSDMEDYFAAKDHLFNALLANSRKKNRVAIVNVDDTYGRRIKASGGATLWTYGKASDTKPDFAFEILHQDFAGMRYRLKTPQGECEVRLPMTGLHNVYNSASAIAVGLAAGAPLETCLAALAGFTGVPGRLEAVPNKNNLNVFVDYAHTDDALRGVLTTLDNVRKDANLSCRLITVFGCGGDRDKGKRPLMMKAALGGSDIVYVTSDNPRTEDPEAIINDALVDVDRTLIGKKVLREVDRREAIHRALKEAKAGDVVLIAGKGHEDYQQIGTQKFPFSDVDVVRKFFED